MSYTAQDFKKGQPRWCPGCGDHFFLASLHKAMAEIGVAPENVAVISGIGCSSRLPHYMATYGMNTIHGRAAAIATGAKVANPNLTVWQVSGDGDGLAIGGNHFIHANRRNIDLNMILLNNRIYGLTKGQYSPTSPRGFVSKSSPYGTVEDPFRPAELCFGARGHFFARCVATDAKGTVEVLQAAYKHKGASVTEVLQNCVIFNDHCHDVVYNNEGRKKNAIYVRHGEKLVFGENMTMKIFKDSVTTTMLAQQYQQQYVDSLTFTDEELESAYAEEHLEFDVADYETLYFNGTAPSTTDADGNTVAATEEAQAAAAEAAKTAYDEALARLESGEVLEHIAPDYEDIANYNHVESGAYTGTDVTKWVFEQSHEDGDYTGIESGASWYLVVFHSCGRPEYNTVNVRHILTLTGDDADAAKATAEANLAEWKAEKGVVVAYASMHGNTAKAAELVADGTITGGMEVKVKAALKAAKALNKPLSVASWRYPDKINALLAGEAIGTKVLPE